MAIAAAKDDSRFEDVTADELKDINIEISVLTPRKKIDKISEIEVGRHGIYIQKDFKSGTYLPHVATQMGWDSEEFVRNCAMEKAGLDSNEIKDAIIFTYEAIVF
jgi:AmmeMemoRadiSam system protein A